MVVNLEKIRKKVEIYLIERRAAMNQIKFGKVRYEFKKRNGFLDTTAKIFNFSMGTSILSFVSDLFL